VLPGTVARALVYNGPLVRKYQAIRDNKPSNRFLASLAASFSDCCIDVLGEHGFLLKHTELLQPAPWPTFYFQKQNPSDLHAPPLQHRQPQPTPQATHRYVLDGGVVMPKPLGAT
jgi:hypothetical protein